MPSINLRGFKQGGFVDGLNQSRSQNRADRYADMQESQIDFNQAKQLYDQQKETLMQLGEQYKRYKSINPKSPTAKKLEESLVLMGGQLSRMGQGLGINADPVVEFLKNPTSLLDDARIEGQMKGAATEGAIDSMAQIPGADRTAIMESQGLRRAPAAPTEFDKKLNLLKTDPDTFQQMYGSSYDPKSSIGKKIYDLKVAQANGDEETAQLIQEDLKSNSAGILSDSKESATIEKIMNTEIGLRNLVDNVGSGLELLNNKETLTGAVGDLGAFASNLKGNIAQLRQFDGVYDEYLADVGRYDDTFDRIGINDAKLRSLVTDLAYSYIASKGDARPSDADMKRAIQQFGGNIGNKNAMQKTMVDVVQRAAGSFQNTHKVMVPKLSSRAQKGLVLDPSLSPDAIGEKLSGLIAPDNTDIPSFSTDEEVSKWISEGNKGKFIAPDGQVYEVPNE